MGAWWVWGPELRASHVAWRRRVSSRPPPSAPRSTATLSAAPPSPPLAPPSSPPTPRSVYSPHLIETLPPYARSSEVVEDSDVIVISIKPQIVKKVLVELKPLLSEEKLLVSITAAIKNERFTGSVISTTEC
ncbi:Pyrroline-5-carboxylate reductase [Triticum urartu]|uniref:Pyrroline-5-carboxylate reductase n=1 Tax=Triticum urartu TaxID=4572 RepID=M7YPJ0_TRIUA|nr:Pyrroline-5-carboxylate reductase [Triticum urartu]